MALFGCGPKVISVLSVSLAEKVFGVDAGVIRVGIRAGLQDHDDLFERAIARALADSVDGALHLSRPGFDRRQGIRHRQPQVVMAVNAHNGAIPQRPRNLSDQGAIFFRRRVTHRVGNVHRPRACSYHRFRNLLQEFRLRARAVFRRKLHVIDVSAG